MSYCWWLFLADGVLAKGVETVNSRRPPTFVITGRRLLPGSTLNGEHWLDWVQNRMHGY